MVNKSNIYDINGDLLRAADDNTQLSVAEAEQRLNKYGEQLKEEKDEHKAGVLKTYIQNLQRYILNYYIEHPEEAQRRVATEAQIQKAMEELKQDLEKESPTIMDEYVEPIEEIKDEHEI